MWWLSELSSSLKFIRITGAQKVLHSKRVYEFVVPGALAFVVFGIYFTFPDAFVKTFLRSYAGNVFQFMVFVVPFHLAALAAFATYQASGLDEKLSGVNAQLRVWSNQDNDYFYVDLTLRQYVSLLFGYLCSIGVLYIVIYLFASNIRLSVVLGGQFNAAYNIAVFAAVFFIFHYVTLTVYAITFLFDKVNRIRSL